ncbi:MAG: type II toxin-antitoxin system ParD family antitoxin [Rhodospirillaceae bacterium]
MPTRNVVLTDQQESLISHLVEGGRYQNASEILREGLRLVEEREAELDALTWQSILAPRVDAVTRGEGHWLSEEDFWRSAEATMDRIDSEDETDQAS